MILRNAFFRDVPGERELFDYGERTDGQSVYAAHAPIDAATTDKVWVVFFFKFNDDGSVAEKYSKGGIAWDSRVSEFAEYWEVQEPDQP
ncbi:MAG: hypothetical protein MUF15_28230 [Acidobacteria bacterium]|nr:hypothetical protein [Acidobacteriota bacterium]